MKKMERLDLSTWLLSTALMWFIVQASCAWASPTTLVEVGSITLNPNQTGQLPINVNYIPANGGLGAYDINVTFDSSVVEVIDVLGGSPPFDTVTAKNINNITGQVRFNHFITATQGPVGNITIAYLKLKAVGNPGSTSEITAETISLVNANTGDEITPRNEIPGSVTVKTTQVYHVIWEDTNYPVTVRSNSTTSNFKFNQTKAEVSFNVTGEPGTVGYCNVTIPNNLLWGSFTVYVDGTEVHYTETTNDTHTFLYFTYEHSTKKIHIQATEAIPEFPTPLIIPLFMIATLIAVILYRRKLKTGKE